MKIKTQTIHKYYLAHTKLIQILLFLFVFLFTFILRAHNYEKTPGIGHLEEQMFGWAGIYLIEEGTPVAWSSLNYPDRAEIFRGKIDYNGGQPEVHVRLYKPWLEQPPLYSLISGGSAHLFGANRHMVLPNAYIRFPTIIIATLTALMIFLIARLVSGFWTGLLAMFLYGSVPIFVFGSRLSVPENLIALFLMIMVYLLLKYQQAQQWQFVIWLPILAGLAGLSKPTGYFLMPLAAFYALRFLKWKHLAYIVLGVVPFILAYIWYGTYFDKEIFWFIQSRQSLRPVGFADLGWFFISPAYDIFMLTDTWYILCLMSAIFFIFKGEQGQKRLILFALVFWLIIIMISGGETDVLPWYRYPAFPLLAIIGAWGIKYLFSNINFFSQLFTVSMFLGNFTLSTNPFRWSIPPMNFRIFFTSLVLPSVFLELYQKRWLINLTRAIMVLVFIIGVFWNIKYIYNQFELSCENLACTQGPTTKLSEVYFPIIHRLFVLDPPEKH